MIEYIKYRYRLWKILHKKKRLKQEYRKYIEEVKNDNYEKESRIAEAMAFQGLEDKNISELHTSYLCYKAKILIVPLPDSKDESCWENNGNSIYSMSVLTGKGIYELKRAIRIEKKEKKEVIFSWVTMIIGIIGALIGLVSVIKK